MREIKFRAWDAKESCMWGWDSDGFVYYHTALMRGYMKDPFYLMQYTGLKDKNGKEIYEGDIVRSAYGVFYDTKIYPSFFNNTPKVEIFTVEFKDGSYNKQLLPPNDNNFGYEIEVIGNIYENKELLK